MFVDTTLPFRLRSETKIFNAIADAVQFISVQKGIRWVTHYLDDFLVLGPLESDESKETLSLLQEICQSLGIPSFGPEKNLGPSTVLEFLGIIIDTVRLMIHLPERKKLQLQQIIAQLMSKKSATKQELQSLAGKYNTLQRLLNQAGASLGQLMNWWLLERRLVIK